jgi:hypothetical protein
MSVIKKPKPLKLVNPAFGEGQKLCVKQYDTGYYVYLNYQEIPFNDLDAVIDWLNQVREWSKAGKPNN